jgi:site-specific DNA-methyltransferase (adenine-specific)
MVEWTRLWTQYLHPGGAFYVWGGTGSPGFRPFFRYLSTAEIPGEFELANLITWKKRRGYGVQNNYLYTREECAFFVNGNAKKPRTFHVPYLDEERGYAGYNEKYPAKDSRFRRTNVWTDITEIMRGKIHPTQKQQKLHEIMIEVHTDVGEYVIDPFAGSGVTALAARKLGRKFIIIENDVEHFDATVKRLEKQDE